MFKKALLVGSCFGVISLSSIARADTFSFDFIGPNISGMALLTATSLGGGQFSVTSAIGSISDTVPGSAANGSFSINGVDGYASADNFLYFPAAPNNAQGLPNTSTFVDSAGISFTTSTGTDFNVFAIGDVYSVVNSADNSGGFLGTMDPLTSVTASAPAGAPAPLAGAGLLSFFGAGGIALRKRAKRVLTALLPKGAALA